MLVLRTGSVVRATDPDPGWIKFLIVPERVVLSKEGSWRIKVFCEFLDYKNQRFWICDILVRIRIRTSE